MSSGKVVGVPLDWDARDVWVAAYRARCRARILIAVTITIGVLAVLVAGVAGPVVLISHLGVTE